MPTFDGRSPQILVQRVPNVIVNSISVAPNTVSESRFGFSNPHFPETTAPTGQPAEIDLANNVTLATSQLSGIRPQETTTLSIPANKQTARP